MQHTSPADQNPANTTHTKYEQLQCIKQDNKRERRAESDPNVAEPQAKRACLGSSKQKEEVTTPENPTGTFLWCATVESCDSETLVGHHGRANQDQVQEEGEEEIVVTEKPLAVDSVFGPAKEYAQSIVRQWLALEGNCKVRPDYLKFQPYCSAIKREEMVDAIMRCCCKCRLLPESMYLAVYVMDATLSAFQLTRDQLLCLALTSVLIGAKYEETVPPSITAINQALETNVPKPRVVRLENNILNSMGFDLSHPSTLNFARAFLASAGFRQDFELVHMVTYLLELALLDSRVLEFPHSVQAAAAIWQACQILGRTFPFTEILGHPRDTDEVAAASAILIEKAKLAATGSSLVVFLKYRLKRFSQVVATVNTWACQ